MMRWIVGSSIHFRLLVVVAAAVMMYFGVTQFHKMPVDVLPEFTRPYVEIQTEALGLSAEEVEAMITTPMEADLLNGTPWVEEIRSESMTGLSSIRMYFDPGTDLLDARQLARLQKRVHREQHAGRAEAALKSRMAREGVLEPFELGSLGQPLDGQHLAPLGVSREEATGRDRSSVYQHGARPAGLHVAGPFRAREPQSIAEEVEQQLLRLDLPRYLAAVDSKLELHAGGMPSSAPARRARRIQAAQYSSRKRS